MTSLGTFVAIATDGEVADRSEQIGAEGSSFRLDLMQTIVGQQIRKEFLGQIFSHGGMMPSSAEVGVYGGPVIEDKFLHQAPESLPIGLADL